MPCTRSKMIKQPQCLNISLAVQPMLPYLSAQQHNVLWAQWMCIYVSTLVIVVALLTQQWLMTLVAMMAATFAPLAPKYWLQISISARKLSSNSLINRFLSSISGNLAYAQRYTNKQTHLHICTTIGLQLHLVSHAYVWTTSNKHREQRKSKIQI